MTSPRNENPTNPEVFNQDKEGVAAVFSYDGQLYGMSLPEEDSVKAEYVFTPSGFEKPPAEFGHLSTKQIGLITGGIKASDGNPTAALQREMREELAELLKMPEEEVQETILSSLQWGTPRPVEDFQVVQSIQKDVDGKGFWRGSFKIFLTKIELPKDIFQKLQPILVPLEEENQDQMRPAVAALFAQGHLEERKQ